MSKDHEFHFVSFFIKTVRRRLNVSAYDHAEVPKYRRCSTFGIVVVAGGDIVTFTFRDHSIEVRLVTFSLELFVYLVNRTSDF